MKMVLILAATGSGDAVKRYDGCSLGRKRAVEDVITGSLERWSALLGRLASPTSLAVTVEGRNFPMARTSDCVGELDAIVYHNCNTLLTVPSWYF